MRLPAPFRHTSRTFSGPIGSSTEGPSGRVHMRLAHPVQRFVAPYGAPLEAPVTAAACVSPIQ
eukprot:2579776-Pyramimonas_sp.AAC.1